MGIGSKESRKETKMFYVVTIRIKGNYRKYPQFCAATVDDLFELASILDHTEKVQEFIVSEAGFSEPFLPKQFNWGEFKKWVKYLYQKEN